MVVNTGHFIYSSTPQLLNFSTFQLNYEHMKVTEKEIVPAIDRALLQEELSRDHLLRKTNNANNEIYVVDAHSAPHVMREIGRLRELSFRMAGGGTGEEVDIDGFDTSPTPYQQLIVWDPQAKEIIGGYRFILCTDTGLDPSGAPNLATTELFRFSEMFMRSYYPFTIELGRSFVQPAYQPSRENRKSIFSLDNLWDGLGALVVDHPHVKYFFGKVTMYSHFNVVARDLILYFLERFFPDHDKLIVPIEPLSLKTSVSELEKVFKERTFADNYKVLQRLVRHNKENIPPLINSYMGLSPTMRTFGTALNHHFGGVEETGILVTIGDIYDAKKERHVQSYLKSSVGMNLK